MILRYALLSDYTFNWLSSNKAQLHKTLEKLTNGIKKPSYSMLLRMASVQSFETHVLPPLSYVVIRDLIPEAFYPQNTLRMFIEPGEDSSQIVLPPVLVGRAMRHVEIEVQCPLYGLETLKLLVVAARRLPNLHTLEVDITGSDATTEELGTMGTIEPIEFIVKKMCVTYKHSTVVIEANEWILDPNEMCVLAKLTVSSMKKEAEGIMVRYDITHNRKQVVTG
jgi:hypothetical protein